MADVAQPTSAPEPSPAPSSQVSTSTLAILVFAALIVTVGSTVLLSNRETGYGGFITGFATSDSGNVTLSINSSLNIQVDSLNNTIAFGTCTPRGGSGYYCASNDTIVCDNTNLALGNCTGDTITPQYIRVLNIGNVNASVNVSSACTPAQLIGGTAPAVTYITNNCDGGTGSNISTWTSFVTTAAGTTACNRTAVGGNGFRLYVNVTIPNDANPAGCSGGTNTLQFTAIQTT